jgi:PKD repeat protein
MLLGPSIRARQLVLIATAALLLLLGGGASAATAASPAHNPRGALLGVVPRSESTTERSQLHAALRAASTSGLTYHGGPVMRTNRSYAIFWQGGATGFGQSYVTLIDRYLRDVAADSGKRSNVYSSDTQYYDTSGRIAYTSTYGGVQPDSQPYPGSGCVDPMRLTAPCLTDAQIRAELVRFLNANPSLPRGGQTVYILVLPPQVGVCDDVSSTACSFAAGGFCAYHSSSGTANALYTVQPYPDTGGCNVPQHPNGNVDADNTISLVSHEHNETITDPYGTGWFDDTTGYENGDICQFDFGGPVGATGSGQFNQAINGNPYWTQEEWSNIDGACVQRSAARPPSAVFSASPNPAALGQAVSFNATQSSDIDGNITGFSWNFGDGATGSGATPSHAYASLGTFTVTLTVSDDAGASAATTRSVTVLAGAARPTISSLPTGTIKVGRNGSFKYSLKGTPAKSRGRVSFATKNAIAAARRRKISFGSVTFTLTGGGKATVTVKLSRANFAILKRKRSLKMQATVTIGPLSKNAVFTLKAP